MNVTISNLFNQSTNFTYNSNRNRNQVEMKCNVPRDNFLSKIKCLPMLVCQRNWVIITESTKSNSPSQNIAIFCMINSHQSQSPNRPRRLQNTTKCHEMPCNHQFERRYITPTVTYVEKPNRVLLNPLVSGQLTRFQLFIWAIRLEWTVLT